MTEAIDLTNNNTLFCLLTEYDPVTYNKTVQEANWQKGMSEEIEAVRRNDMLEFTTLPEDNKPITVKQFYQTKTNQEGKPEKYQAKQVAKG